MNINNSKAQKDSPLLLNKHVFDAISTGIVVLSPVTDTKGNITDFIYEYLNKEASKMLQIENIEGSSLLTLFPGVITDEIFDIYVSVYKNNRNYRHVFHYEHDNIDAWYSQDIRKAEGNLVISTNDLTAEKREQIRLAESKKLLKHIHNEAPLFIYIVDIEKKELIYTNHFFNDFFELDDNDNASVKYNKFVGSLEQSSIIEFLEKLNFAPDSCREFTFSVNRKTRHFFQAKELAFASNEGNVNQILGIAVDISGQKKLQEEIILKNNQLKEAQGLARMGSWIYNSQTGESEWSDDVYNLFGVNPHDYAKPSHILKKFVYPEDFSKLKYLAKRAIETGEGYQSQYKIKNALGEERVISTKASPEKIGSVICLKGICQDITERYLIENQLRHQTELYSNLLNIQSELGEGIVIIENKKIGFVNKAFCEISGYTEKELYGFEKFFDLLPEEDRVNSSRNFIDDNNLSKALEGRLVKKDGTIIFISYSVKPTINEAGLIQYVCIVRDITDKKNYENELLKKDLLLTEAQRIAHLGSWEWDIVHNKVYWSDELYIMYGYKPGEISVTLETFLGHLFPEEKSIVEHHLSEAFRTHKDFNFEHRLKQKGGAVHTILSKGRVVTNEFNEPIKFIGSAQDITEAKEAEQIINQKNKELTNAYLELKKAQKELILSNVNLEEKIKERTLELEESVNKFQNLIEAIPLVAWTNTPTGEVDFINDTGKRFTGSKDVSGWDWSTLIFEEDHETALKKWRSSLKNGEPFEAEYRWVNKDGQLRWMLGRANPIRDAYGKIILWIGCATEIHEQKAVQERKDEFIGIASHELKTPLTTVKAYLQILERMFEQEKNTKASVYLHRANTFVERLQSLISDLLDVSKIQAGKLLYNMEEFEFDQLVEESLESMQYTSSKHKIIYEGCAKIKFKGDRQRIEQVFSNYISNAIKYSPESDKIIVKVENTGNEICVSIKDFGIGIAKEKLDKVFDRFYRVDDLSHNYTGLGIGLFIASEVIKRHKGKTWVESEPGAGSVFYFSLPLNQEDYE